MKVRAIFYKNFGTVIYRRFCLKRDRDPYRSASDGVDIYPLTVKDFRLKNALDQNIYDVCIHTLRLCMNLHYEDTPWREQALYVLDSRNQMLCGYFAFKETDFARANLELIAKGTRDDGLLELTYPSVDGPDNSIFLQLCIPLRFMSILNIQAINPY